jgi:uncharacterized protein
VTLHQETRFPEECLTRLIVRTNQPVTLGLQIRSPHWLAGEPSARLNGRSAALQSNDQAWVGLRPKWNDGDELVVNLPMRLSVHALLPKQQYPTAVTFGPVVLAVSAPNRSFVHKLVFLGV